MSEEILERLKIREMVDNWIVWRDALQWKEFRGLWHDDGRMMATWTQGTADEFIEMSKQGFAKGVRILHFQGGNSVEIRGDRAISQTKMTISQRAPVHDVVCDVVCTGRFYDFLESAAAAGGLFCASPSTRRTAWTPWTPPPSSASIKSFSCRSARATAISPTCKPRSATKLKWTCQA